MARCVSTYTIGGRTYYISMTQPADITTCTNLLISGSDLTNLIALQDRSTVISQLQADYQTLLNYQSQSFDLTLALGAFSFFFTTVLMFYFWGKSGGQVLEAIRHPLRGR